MQNYFKQFQSLAIITWLELGITDGVSVSLVSPWPWRSAVKQIERSNEARKTTVVINVLSGEERKFAKLHREFLIALYKTEMFSL
jgi:hypothetical protein